MDSESEHTGFYNLLTSQIPSDQFSNQFSNQYSGSPYQHPAPSFPPYPFPVATDSPYQHPAASNSPNPEVVASGSHAAAAEERTKRIKWSIVEDSVLISAWLNISKDSLVGNEQKSRNFWKRIAAYYSASPKVKGLPRRELSQCKQRWRKINKAVNKFVGCYEAASKQRISGQSEDDVLKATHAIYCNDQNHAFLLEHAWRELRNDQKWCANRADSNVSSKRKRDDNSSQADASMASVNANAEMEARPMGVKAAKAKGKRSVGAENNLLKFQTVWELKEKEYALKEKEAASKDKLVNKQLLEKLISKTEPLTEEEVGLKKKLIYDFFSM